MHTYLMLLLSLISFLSPLHATDQTALEQLIDNKNHKELGKLLRKAASRTITLSKLQEIAEQKNSEPLLNAIKTTRIISKRYKHFGLSRPYLLQTAYFIETELPGHVEKGKHFFSKEFTSLPYAIEYDPVNKRCFIILDWHNAYIGEGKKKVVYKALFYDHNDPRMVARADEQTTFLKELHITKKLHGAPGLFETVGFGNRKRHGRQYATYYSELYTSGSLENVFEKGVHLSLYEKMKIALDLLTGLRSLHSQGYVHRDLGARNHLVTIPHGKPGKRAVVAAVADLGRTTQAEKAGDTKVQGNTTYTAPEGLYRKNLSGIDYYKTDVFALGCVFYRLYYGKRAPWQDHSYVKDVKTSLSKRYKEMLSRIKRTTSSRRNQLSKKKELSPKEAFHLLILRMLHTDPKKRGTAEELQSEMEKIFARLQ